MEKVYDYLCMELAQILNKDKEFVQQFPNDTPLSAIGLDSLGTIALIVSIEEQFGIEFEDDDLLIMKFATKEQIYNKVIKYYCLGDGNDEQSCG